MADNTQINPGAGGDIIASDAISDGTNDIKHQKVKLEYGGDGTATEVNETNRLPVANYNYTELDGTIGPNVDDEYRFDNTNGHSTIGFHLLVPVGTKVVFEGSFCGINWTEVTIRQLGEDGYTSYTYTDEDFIGSIVTLRHFRLRVDEIGDGTSVGQIHGRATNEVSVLEGMEHGNPPHKIGHSIIRFGVDITAPVTDEVLFTPSMIQGHYKKFVITGYQLSVSGTGSLEIYDENNLSGNWIVAISSKVQVTESTFLNHQFYPPFVSSTAGNEVKITATGSVVVKGVITGYEIM